ncbi:hypothetical protein [Rhodococcus sp. IEGM 1379]|uniref:hypothetical protein n=1 Tax=Rhodococcus sp. IEGM 1379 TaxID=3047086 RepID=UPI0024B815C1|nr:hypothetical protein [Rhodococcus sp. IEGM 1379]MDI9914247.1 hypothetical protein [Rhodococcus sp. IEGM 1379]
MSITTLLTDDEILAVSLHGGSNWPGLLPSVAESAALRTVAAMRGVRSMLVRELARADNDSLSFPADIHDHVDSFRTAKAVFGYHVSTLDAPVFFGGDGAAIAVPAFGEARINSVTSAGVHRLSRSDSSTVARSLRDLLVGTYSVGEASELGVLIYAGIRPGASVLWVSRDRIVRGVFGLDTPERGSRLIVVDRLEVDGTAIEPFVCEVLGSVPTG